MGRLIDAERLKTHYCWWAGGGREMTIDEAKKTFDTIIDLQPTVDAEPVRHGHWKWDGDYICSNCGERGHRNKWNYCPNCGAKMDEVEA